MTDAGQHRFAAANYQVNRAGNFIGTQYDEPERLLGPVGVFLTRDAPWFIAGESISVDGGHTSLRRPGSLGAPPDSYFGRRPAM